MERVFEASDYISRLLFEDGLKQMDFSWIFSESGMIAAIVAGVIAFLMIFLGAKCKYLLFALQGFLAGATAGLAAAWYFKLDHMVLLGISAAAAIILAIFEVVFRRFGAFIFSFAAIFISVLALAGGRGYIVLGAAALVALIFAILSAVFGDPMIIPVMGIGGGVLGGLVVSKYIPYDNILVFYGASLILAVLGICTQYALKSSKIAKMERKKAKEIRARKSVESEIEMARNILDSDGNENTEK